MAEAKFIETVKY